MSLCININIRRQEIKPKFDNGFSSLAFGEVDLLDGSSRAIALQDLNALEGLRHKLGDQVVGIEDPRLEGPRWRDGGGVHVGVSQDSHVLD